VAQQGVVSGGKMCLFFKKKGCKIDAAECTEPQLASSGCRLRLQTSALLLPPTDRFVKVRFYCKPILLGYMFVFKHNVLKA